MTIFRYSIKPRNQETKKMIKMENAEKKTSDIGAMVNGNRKKKVPRFLVNYLKKIAHEKEINECIINAEHKVGVGFFKEALDYLDIKFEVKGAENLPKDGRYLFAANHPLGGPEALIVGEVFRQQFGESFRVPVNSILSFFTPLKEFFVPINLMSKKQDRVLSQRMQDMFDSKYQV